MIRRATDQDVSGLKNIWEKCFTEEQEYIINFFNNCFPYSTTFIIEIDNTIVSCLSILPSHASITTNNSNIRIIGGYLYAVGTLPEHRNNGYSRRLIDFVKNYCTKLGYTFISVFPANESLYSLYDNMGFNVVLHALKNKIEFALRNSFQSNTLQHVTNYDNLFDQYKKQSPSQILLFDTSLNDYIICDLKNKSCYIQTNFSRDFFIFSNYIEKTKTIETVGIIPPQILKESSVLYPINPSLNSTEVTYISPITSNFRDIENQNIIKRGLLFLIDHNYRDQLENLFLLFTLE